MHCVVSGQKLSSSRMDGDSGDSESRSAGTCGCHRGLVSLITEGLRLPVTKQIQPIRTSQIISLGQKKDFGVTDNILLETPKDWLLC